MTTTEKTLPYNERAEEALLASLMQYDSSMDDVTTIITPEDFYKERHREIYRHILKLYNAGQSIYPVSVSYEMGSDDADLFNFLVHLSECVSFGHDAVYNARIVANESQRRRMMMFGNQVFGDAAHDSDAPAIIERAESALFEIANERSQNEVQAIADVSTDYLGQFTNLLMHKGEMRGLSTGFRDLDFPLRGMREQQMITIAARPGQGKSALALGMAYHLSFQGDKKGALFTLEMSRSQVFDRLVSMRAQIDTQRLSTPWQLSTDEQERALHAIQWLENQRFFIDDTSAITTVDLRSKAKRLHRLHKLDYIIIDYLQLMRALDSSGKRMKDRQQEIAEISMCIKALAKELNIPVIALAQLNRDVESRQVKIPQLSDLRESGQIEQDSDVVMFIYRDEMYNAQSERPGQADIIIAKHRNGPTGEVALHFEGRFTQFSNLEKWQEEKHS